MLNQADMETPDIEPGYIPMNSVHSFRLSMEEESVENIYDNPVKYRPVSWSTKVCQVGKKTWGHVLCLGLPFTALLVVVLLLARNNMKRDELQDSYMNLTREWEALQTRLQQLDNIQRNMIEEKDRLQTRISELVIREQNLTYFNERNIKKLSDLGWHHFNFSWYFVSSQKKNWTDSREDCKRKGLDLVVINSQEEQLFLARMAVQAWIGLSDLEQEGVWKWVDDTNITIRYWDKDQPNDFQGQDCGLIWDRTNRLKTWNDEKCSRKLQWICEM